MKQMLYALVFGLLPFGVADAAPRVVTDIAPVHSLVARVMEGVETPVLLLPPNASPHGYAMRPGEAQALSDAQLVFWVGETLTPWLAHAVESLANRAQIIELGAVEGLVRLGYREGVAFDAHDHHAHAHADEHDSEIDPHFWLDPVNAILWVKEIAARLSNADPQNAARYAANATVALAELSALKEELEAQLADFRDAPFIVFHDGYHYFEARFGVEAVGALSLSDAAMPGPKRLRAIHRTIEETGVRCIFAEPQQSEKLIRVASEGTDARMAMLDPLGASLEPGPALYPALMRNMASSLTDCLGAQ